MILRQADVYKELPRGYVYSTSGDLSEFREEGQKVRSECARDQQSTIKVPRGIMSPASFSEAIYSSMNWVVDAGTLYSWGTTVMMDEESRG